MSVDKKEAMREARKAANKAGEILKKSFHDHQQTRTKTDGDIVTQTDLKADRAITNHLTDVFPNHAIDSEESSVNNSDADYVWRVDPLDGTENFSHGLPLFTSSLALMYEGEPVIGVIHNPLANTTYSAILGEGAQCDGESLSVSDCEIASEALGTIMAAGHYSPSQRTSVSKLFSETIQELWSVRLIVSQALELAAIAAGRIDGTVCLKSRGYSAAAGILLVREAGGRITDVMGHDYDADSTSLVASNGNIHETLLDLIEGDLMSSNQQ